MDHVDSMDSTYLMEENLILLFLNELHVDLMDSMWWNEINMVHLLFIYFYHIFLIFLTRDVIYLSPPLPQLLRSQDYFYFITCISTFPSYLLSMSHLSVTHVSYL